MILEINLFFYQDITLLTLEGYLSYPFIYFRISTSSSDTVTLLKKSIILLQKKSNYDITFKK